MKKLRPKIVWLPYGTAPKIAKALGTSEKSVSCAVNGREDSELSRRIRYVAIKEYGCVAVTYYEEDVPDCDSEYKDGIMTQEFSDRVKIVADFNTGIVGAYIDGELKSKCQPQTIQDFMKYQQSVIEVANSLNK